MNKYDEILRKHKIMTKSMMMSIYIGFVSGIIYFFYKMMKYGMVEENTYTLFISLGIFLIFPILTTIILKIKYKKLYKLSIYNKDAVSKSINYILNGDSYNNTIKQVKEYLDKFKNGEITKDDMLDVIFETHYDKHRNDILNHSDIIKISNIIKCNLQ